MKNLSIIIFFFFLTQNLAAEVCRLKDANGNLIRVLAQENSCEQDLEAGGIALINSINKENAEKNIPSTTEKNTAQIMLNYVTKNLVGISQLDQLTTSFGASITPSGTLANSCTLDQINELGKKGECASSINKNRIQALFGKSIEEVVSEHFVSEIMKTRNSNDAENNANQCLSSKDASLIGQQTKRMELFSGLMMMSSLYEWDSEKNKFVDESLNSLIASDATSFITNNMNISPNDPNLPFIASALKNEDGIKSFFQAMSNFKKENPNADFMRREDNWKFYQSLFNDSDLISNMRTSLADQCDKLFKNFTDFICRPISFHATNNQTYIDNYAGGNNPTKLTNTDEKDSTYYLDYLYQCQGKHCYNENTAAIIQNYCVSKNDQEDSFNLNEFLNETEAYEPLAITEGNNQFFREVNIYGRANRMGEDLNQSPEQLICNEICQNQPQCSPRKTAAMIRQEFKCGTAEEMNQCTAEMKTWLEMQDMQESYTRVIAERNSTIETKDEEGVVVNNRTDFMNHFLGNIGQEVIAGKTPTLSGIVKTEDRTTLSRETLADAAEGTSDFDTPARPNSPRRKSLTETLADIQTRGNSTNAVSTTTETNNRTIASTSGAFTPRPFTPLQPGSLGSQMASSISTRDRETFVKENAELMRELLRGGTETFNQSPPLDNLLTNNERKFNSGVNVNNNFSFPEADSTVTTNERTTSDFGFGVNGAPVEAPDASNEGTREVAATRGGTSKASAQAQIASTVTGGTTGGTSGPVRQNDGPSYNATVDNIETITLEELRRQNIPLDKPFNLLISAGNKSVTVRVVPMQHRGETILSPDISSIGEDEYFVYPLLKKTSVFQKFFAYREERLNSIRSI